jgi:hypothetical protein
LAGPRLRGSVAPREEAEHRESLESMKGNRLMPESVIGTVSQKLDRSVADETEEKFNKSDAAN